MYDAVIVLGGSFIDQNTLPEWVCKRLDRAATLDYTTKVFLLLSRGTPHKAPPIDDKGHPIDECQIMAKYLIKKGISPTKIILDSWSRDTIGNAYAALTMHAIPCNMRKIMVITSTFHMERTQSIFEKVFSLLPFNSFELVFLKTPSTLTISNKEMESLIKWRETEKQLHTLLDLHEFIYTKHKCYSVNSGTDTTKVSNYSDADMRMYCV